MRTKYELKEKEFIDKYRFLTKLGIVNTERLKEVKEYYAKEIISLKV
jgi:hypothetical protein